MLLALAGEIKSSEFSKIIEPLISVCNTLVPILLSAVAAIGAIWCIVLGVKYAKADDPQEHEKAKNGLKNAILGYVIIFLLLIMLYVGHEVLENWWLSYSV